MGATRWENRHEPVLLEQVLGTLRPGDAGVRRLIDGTLGGGGHCQALLDAGVQEVLACDVDAAALRYARRRLADFGPRLHLHHGSYVTMGAAAQALGWTAVDAILLDLGLSSLQLEDGGRGFSFRDDAPLDMRFDADGDGERAQELVNGLPVEDLAQLFRRYGEERHARRIAQAIVDLRPINSARALGELIVQALPAPARRKAKIHPATRVFQALRIAVNRELDAVREVLPLAVDLLRPGGRLAVISFHSLEDRIVKRSLREMATERLAPPGMASLPQQRARVKLLTRRPILPDMAELRANPRSRSAKLRSAEKLDLRESCVAY